MTLKEDLNCIEQGIKIAEAHLEHILQAMADLERAGMYPSIPSEQWQSRNGSGPIYLYHLFRWDGDGYAGPDGKQKVYIGCKPAKIEAARTLARNRRHWEQLDSTRRQLKNWLANIDGDVRRLARQAESFPHVDAFLWQKLGQDHAAATAPGEPK